MISYYKCQIESILNDYQIDYKLKLDARLKYAMAIVNFTRKTLTINKDILTNPRLFYLLNDTLYHEIAHIIAYEHFNIDDHGPIWKQICNIIGAIPKSHHKDNYYLIEQLKKQYRYMMICDECEKTIFTNLLNNNTCNCGSLMTPLIKDKKTKFGFIFKQHIPH